MLYGILWFCLGVTMYLCGVLMVVPRLLFGLNTELLPLNEWIVWYSGMPIVLGIAFTLLDLLVTVPHQAQRGRGPLRFATAAAGDRRPDRI